MMQRAFKEWPGLHVGIIMDGNGRWATARGKPRSAGHAAGARMVRRVVEAAPAAGIGVLTLFAFSADNWRRPSLEVTALMRLFRKYLASETARCVQNGVRMCVIGRRDRLSGVLVRAIEAAEEATIGGERLLLRIAIDYSGRDAVLAAAGDAVAGGVPTLADFGEALARAVHSPLVPDVDLLVRTGGEHRLSDFMLWEGAYAELYFEDRMWPDFGEDGLRAAVAEFGHRERRYGGLPQSAAL